MAQHFVPEWRRRKSAAFDLANNSSAKGTSITDLWGRPVEMYGNVNFSIYSAQACNARCRFCAEELRPASRGRELQQQRRVEADDGVYFEALQRCLEALRSAQPTISITGGEPSKDARLPRMLELCAGFASRRRSLSTNGSGLSFGLISICCVATRSAFGRVRSGRPGSLRRDRSIWCFSTLRTITPRGDAACATAAFLPAMIIRRAIPAS